MAKPSKNVALIDNGINDLKSHKRIVANDIRYMQTNRKKYHHILNHIVTPEDGNGRISVNKHRVYVTYRNLSGFKDDLRLETTLQGLTLIGEPTHTQDYASILNRDYTFVVKFPDGDEIDVIISAYVSEDSKTCRKVIVGQEHKVVDKYELVCD